MFLATRGKSPQREVNRFKCKYEHCCDWIDKIKWAFAVPQQVNLQTCTLKSNTVAVLLWSHHQIVLLSGINMHRKWLHLIESRTTLYANTENFSWRESLCTKGRTLHPNHFYKCLKLWMRCQKLAMFYSRVKKTSCWCLHLPAFSSDAGAFSPSSIPSLSNRSIIIHCMCNDPTSRTSTSFTIHF